MKKLEKVAAVLILLGGINWGLVGLFGFDLIGYVFGRTWIDTLVYILIGLSALYKIICWQASKGR